MPCPLSLPCLVRRATSATAAGPAFESTTGTASGSATGALGGGSSRGAGEVSWPA